MGRNGHNNVGVIGWYVDYFVLLGIGGDKVQVLNCSWNGGLEPDYLRYQGDGAIFNPDNYRNFYGLEGGGHGDGEVDGGAIVHKFNFEVDDEEVVGFQDEIFLCFISFGGLPIAGERAVDINLHIDAILFA